MCGEGADVLENAYDMMSRYVCAMICLCYVPEHSSTAAPVATVSRGRGVRFPTLIAVVQPLSPEG